MRLRAYSLLLFLVAIVLGTVTAEAQATSMASSANPSVYGNAVTFTASVQPATTTSYAPTGTVTFYDGTSPIGSGSLDGQGVAQLTTGSLSVGVHSITASYSGDAHFAPATSQPYTQGVVSESSFTLASTPSNATVSAGQSAQYGL